VDQQDLYETVEVDNFSYTEDGETLHLTSLSW
jgi:hypothetical protein